jgi:hypothetical protein
MKDAVDAVAELDGLDLGDERRSARARRIVASLQANPAAAFPRAMGSVAEREAFYRLINNDAVSHQALVAPHRAQAIGRMCEAADRPIIAIDKTRFIFEGEAEREGLERISANKQGIEVFFALAVSPSRRTFGIVGVEPLDASGRSTALEWDGFADVAGCEIEAAGLEPIYVMDREADVYGLFCSLSEKRRDFVIRVSWDRVARELGGHRDHTMRDLVARAPISLVRTVPLSRRPNGSRTTVAKQKHPSRASREAKLAIRACTVILSRPSTKKLAALPERVTLQLVQVIELDVPKGTAPVEWLLATSLPIDDDAAIEAIVDAYRARWSAEEYFKALKTGCKFEERQLESRDALLNALGLLIPIAWRLLELRTLADDEPSAPASVVLDDDEIHILRKISRDVKLGNEPTIAEALLAIAGVGGHIRQNGRPGWQVLHRGFDELLRLVDGYRLAREEM